MRHGAQLDKGDNTHVGLARAKYSDAKRTEGNTYAKSSIVGDGR